MRMFISLLGMILALAVSPVRAELAIGVSTQAWLGHGSTVKATAGELDGQWLSSVAYQRQKGRDYVGAGLAWLPLGEAELAPLVSASANWDARDGRCWEYLGAGLLWQGGRDWAVRVDLVWEAETDEVGLFVGNLLFLR